MNLNTWYLRTSRNSKFLPTLFSSITYFLHARFHRVYNPVDTFLRRLTFITSNLCYGLRQTRDNTYRVLKTDLFQVSV